MQKKDLVFFWDEDNYFTLSELNEVINDSNNVMKEVASVNKKKLPLGVVRSSSVNYIELVAVIMSSSVLVSLVNSITGLLLERQKEKQKPHSSIRVRVEGKEIEVHGKMEEEEVSRILNLLISDEKVDDEEE